MSRNLGTLTTLDDVIRHVILPALGEHAADHDVAAIAAEGWELVADEDENGRELVTTRRYEPVHGSEAEFWELVQRHRRPPTAPEELTARLAEIGRVAATADAVIDEAIQAGVPLAQIARLTGRDRSGLHRRRERMA